VTADADVVASCARIRRLLDQGAPWDAGDVFRIAVVAHPVDAELLYCGALAHARAGASQQAALLLDRAQRATDPAAPLLGEILSLRGRLWKDRLVRSADQASHAEYARRARDEYLAAYALRGDTFPGINAATLSMLMGDRPAALALARAVIERLEAKRGPLDAWDHATQGEAHLLLGEMTLARKSYATACAQARIDAGSVAAMRRQIKLLERVLPQARELLDDLPAADVLAFVGHMIDAPTGTTPRFPFELEPAVGDLLRRHMAGLHLPIVYASAACGADLMFIEAALDVGAEVNVVLPFDRNDFVRTRVAVGGESWVRRFDSALERVNRIILATEEGYLGDDVLFEHAVWLIEGLSALRASQLQSTPSLLCVLDPQSPSRTDHTVGAFDRWRRLHGEPHVVDLAELRRQLPADIDGGGALSQEDAKSAPETMPAESRPQRTLKILLFADISGFGRLHDAYAPLFHSRFLGVVSKQIQACAVQPLEANTWGDALYVVFAQAEEGAEFALGLLERMQEVDWTAQGLADTSQIRIALHAGPVFCGFDPIMGRDNYFGSSVTKTARMEPVTPPGAIYASENFVATLAAAGQDRYSFDYMGRLELAKGYGESRIYRLDRR